jgi:lactoylglutathione lyase
MSAPAESAFNFTKLVVGDLEKSHAFYTMVCGLEEWARIDSELNGEPFAEIMYKPQVPGGPSFVLVQFLNIPAPPPGETILGFMTPDLDAFIARAQNAGGKILQPVKMNEEHKVKVGFVTDLEGRIIEVVEPFQK